MADQKVSAMTEMTYPPGASDWMYAAQGGNPRKVNPQRLASRVLKELDAAGGVASLDFTSIISSDFDTYELELIGIIPVTNNAALLLEVSQDNGSSWDQTSGHYASNYIYNKIGAGTATFTGPPTTSITIDNGMGTDGAEQSLSASIIFRHPLSSVLHKPFGGMVSSWSLNEFYMHYVFGIYQQTAAFDAIRIRAGTGDLASGIARLRRS